AYVAVGRPEKSGIRARAVRRPRSMRKRPPAGGLANSLTIAHREPVSRTKSSGFFGPQIWSRVQGSAASAADERSTSARAAAPAIVTTACANSFAEDGLMAVIRPE